MTEFNNGYIPVNPAAAAAPAAKPRKGRGLSMAAMIMGIVTFVLTSLSFLSVLASAYSWQQMAVIRISAFSIVLLLPALLSMILGIIASVRGGGIGRMIAAVATSAVSILMILYNIYILIYYIGMVF